jgi:phage pi2 protein 07
MWREKKMTEYKTIFKNIRDIATTGTFHMALLKKTASKKDECKREVLAVEIDNAVKDKFSTILNNACESIINNDTINFINFFEDEGEDNTILVLSSEDLEHVGTLFPIIRQVQCEDDVEYVKELNEKVIDKLQTYVICVQKRNADKNYKQTCIYFRKYGKGYRIAKNGLLAFKNGKFEKIDSDIFKCDTFIDAIYYELLLEKDNEDDNEISIQIMFVKDTTNFEDIFAFHELYKREGKKLYDFFESHDHIEIQEGLFQKIDDKISYLKQMTQLSKKDLIDNFDFDSTKKIYEKASKNYALNFEIVDDKVIINNKEALKDFLAFCGKEIVRDPLDDSIFLKSKGNKELPRKT